MQVITLNTVHSSLNHTLQHKKVYTCTQWYCKSWCYSRTSLDLDTPHLISTIFRQVG